MTEHTPFTVSEGYTGFFVQNLEGHAILQTPSKELAEFVVTACNDYDKDKKLIEDLVEEFAKQLYVRQGNSLYFWGNESEERKNEYRQAALKKARK